MRRAVVAAVVLAALGAAPQPARAAECSKVVVVALPGVTWSDVARVDPPNIMTAAESGAIGSMSVRTVTGRTSYASGFATIGAGARVDGGRTTGTHSEGASTPDGLFQRDVVVSGLTEMRELADEAGYQARPGALTTALERGLDDFYAFAIGNSDLGLDPPIPFGGGRWAPLAVMDVDGDVPFAATSEVMLEGAEGYPFGVRTSPETAATAISSALSVDGCGLVVIDPGDLTRVDELSITKGDELQDETDRALMAADGLVGVAMGSLTEGDLLLVVSATSPGWDPENHLGVAIASGPGFPSGSMLTSGSTRASDLVTLPDVAPTVMSHFGVEQPPEMLGRPFFARPSEHDDRVAAMVDLDDEAVYSHGIQADIATGYVVFQVFMLGLIVLLLRREGEGGGYLDEHRLVRRCLEWGALAIVSFPLAVYLSSPLPAHELRLIWLVPAMIAIDLALVAIVSFVISQPLDRLMALALATVTLMVVDLTLGGPLQFMAVFGNDPINAGRFAGLGNSAFSVLGACSILAAALMMHKWGGRRWVVPAIAVLFTIVVIADGAPQLGSDVGGVLALVPSLAITFMLLLGKRPSWRVLVAGVIAAIAVLGLFLAIDLGRPLEERTHLGTFFTSVRDRGAAVFFDTLERKARTNLRVFRSTIWTYLVPPALAVIAYLLFRPRGSWRRFAAEYPRLRAGLIGGLVLCVLGFAVNDSGIVVPAMILSFLVPLALLTHLRMQMEA
ncbi:MAG: hypothetical protein KY391_02475 [Actinobacteria bacterium]|nr:hypothetical protein [Actinomycetota bacterium]